MAISGVGTVFMRWNSDLSVPALEAIANVKSITGPSATRGTSDTTALDTAGGYRTFIPGFRDAGGVSLTLSYTRDGYEKMLADYQSDVAGNYQIILPDTDSTTIEFEGFVTEIPLTIPEEVITFAVTIKLSGAFTVNSGS